MEHALSAPELQTVMDEVTSLRREHYEAKMDKRSWCTI